MFLRTFPGMLVRRRAVALIAAISVLAILTILVMGLAASHSGVRDGAAQMELKQKAMRLVRSGYDAALVELARSPLHSGETRRMALPATNGVCSIAMSPAGAGDSFYDGKFLSHRPGDAILTVDAVTTHGATTLRIEHVYLVNTDPGKSRRLRLNEKMEQRLVLPNR